MRRRDRHQCPCRRRNHDRSRRSPQPRLPKRAARFPDPQSAMLIIAPRSLPSGASPRARTDSGHRRRGCCRVRPWRGGRLTWAHLRPICAHGTNPMLIRVDAAPTASSSLGSRRSSAGIITAHVPRSDAHEVSRCQGCCMRARPAHSCRAYNDKHNGVHRGSPLGKDFSHVRIA